MPPPFVPPVEPMLATLARTLPEGDVLDEPKWDGFWCPASRDGDCLVAGARTDTYGVSSLLLGVHDGDELVQVGLAAAFARARKRELDSRPRRAAGRRRCHSTGCRCDPRSCAR